jgi:AAA family ATP:ADP antiporter
MQETESRTLRTHPELQSHRSFPTFRSIGDAPRTWLERLLSAFADVRAGEGVGAVLLAVNVFLLLATYYLLKTVREQLILSEGSAEQKVYASAAQAVLLLGVVPLYGWLSTKVKRIRLVAITSLFFAANLVVFAVLGSAGVREGVVFYIWLGIFNLFVISQFWAFANDVYTEGQGRRLFPFIGVGASLGAWLGAEAAVEFVTRFLMTPYTVMIISAGLLVVCLGITAVVNSRERRNADPVGAHQAEAPLGPEGAFSLIRRTPYLFWIAVLTVLLNVVNTSGEFILSKLVVDAASAQVGDAAELLGDRQRFIGAFYGSFFGWVNLLGLVLQLFVTSRVMRLFGVRGTLFILPLVALVNYAVIAVAPLLAVVRVTKTLENSTDYSIQNTIRQALFLPTSREAKYKAKTAIDTLGTRLGDVLQAGVVRVGTALGASVTAFAWFNVILTVAWLLVAGRIAREHRKQTV